MPTIHRVWRQGLRKTLKVAAIALALVAIVAIAAVFTAHSMGESKLARTVDVRVVPVAYATDAAALRRGKYLFESRGCGECHGMTGAGRVMFEDSGGLHVRAPNITPSPGSVVAAYQEADWVRAIRHGVSPRGRALLIMPSEDYNRLTDTDFASLVAYTRSLPPAAGPAGEVRLPPWVKALYGAGAMRDAAEKIDHRLPPSAPVAVAASVEHGSYVANMCIGCHGAGLAGGKIPGSPPDWPPAPKLTPGEGSAMARYDSLDKFVAMMRTGKRPDATAVSNVMPFASLARMNDVDLQALYAYLGTVSARKAGSP